MKKIISIISIILILCILSGCNGKKSYDFLNDKDEIVSIEIVKLCEYDQGKGEYKEELIATVDDHTAFLSDFNEVDYYNHFTDPTGVFEGDIVIKITYKNGEYEMINHSGQGKYIHFEDSPSFFSAYAGHRGFNEEQFDKLIEKYSNE